MARQINVRGGSDSSSSSDPSRFAELDSQTQDGAFNALSAAALVYAAVYFVAFVSDWMIANVAEGKFLWPSLLHVLLALGSIGYATWVGLRCRMRRCTRMDFARMATFFLIVSSLGISLHLWGWEQDGRQVAFSGISWVGVWIVMYPTIVTLPPRQVLAASLSAWATLPVTAITSLLVHGEPEHFEGSTTISIASVSVPVLICVGIAYVVSYRVFCLARDVSKARRLGSYQLSEKIGAGGMGEVWKANHRMLRRPAAIKLIRPESLGADDSNSGRTALRRFEREAQATAMLTSPHSIVLYDFGIGDDGVFYYVMELLEGRDLKTLVQEHGPLPAERALHFLSAACDSLADAHHRGLIHRDVKPANLYACRRGRDFDFLKILDFGLVKSVRDPGESITQLTGAGVTSGTPGFMAPEMVTGEHAVDARSDIYGLGCVAYWMLTGQLVFDGKNPLSLLVQHVKEDPPPMSSRTELEVPPRLEEIVRACLAKNPSDRPGSADQLQKMFDELITTMPAWTPERAEKWWRINLPNLHAAPVSGPLDTAATVIDA